MLSEHAVGIQNTHPFVLKGSHGNVTAYCLPAWLLPNIVHDMNMKIGGDLRKELILLRHSELPRNRANSFNSDTSSVYLAGSSFLDLSSSLTGADDLDNR